MSVQINHRFNVKEYYRMGETGVLAPDARVELLNGEIIDMSPIGPFHSGVVGDMAAMLVECSKRRWLVRSQSPLRLSEDSEPQPDIMLLKPAAHRYRDRHPKPEEVFLLVEVSDASLQFDRGEKLSAYGRAGIAEVWIVNLVDQTVEINREPHFTGYGSKTILRSGEKAAPRAFPDASVDVAELLRR